MSTLNLVEVVDDDDDVRRMLVIILKAHGYAVRLHASARAYLDAAPSSARRVMLLDVRMPEMTGIELQALLTQRADPVPVIFMSGESPPHETQAAQQSNAVDFLWKPFRTDTLLTAIHKGLQAYDQRQGALPPSSHAHQVDLRRTLQSAVAVQAAEEHVHPQEGKGRDA